MQIMISVVNVLCLIPIEKKNLDGAEKGKRPFKTVARDKFYCIIAFSTYYVPTDLCARSRLVEALKPLRQSDGMPEQRRCESEVPPHLK